MIPVALIVGGLTKVFGVTKLISFLLLGIYLLLIKYALAHPLVVVEKMEASPALSRSWKMTKGHFWYVAGCYLFIGISVLLIRWVVYSMIADQGE